MGKSKPVKKGYQINLSRVQDIDDYTRHCLEDTIVAENEKEARRIALSNLDDQGITEDSLGDPLTYITVQVRRCPELDQLMVDGQLRTKWQIDRDKEIDERDNGFRQLLLDNPNAYAFIRKGGSYYQPNCCGYTEYESYAGVYTLEFAVKHCLGMSLGDYMRPILIDVEKHNAMINKQIEGLKTRLILKEEHNNG